MAAKSHSEPRYDSPIRLKNGYPAAPPFAMLAWNDTHPDGVWEVVPPLNSDDLDVITGPPYSIQPNSEGLATDDRARIVSYQTADGIPQVGEQWGVKKGDYYLRKGYRGFRITSQGRADGTVNVMRLFSISQVGSGSGSGSPPPDQVGSQITIPALESLAGSGCNLTASGTIYTISLLGGVLSIAPTGSFSVPVALGPFPVHASFDVTTVDKTGTFSGTVGGCAVTVTGTVPGQTVHIDLSGATACP